MSQSNSNPHRAYVTGPSPWVALWMPPSGPLYGASVGTAGGNR